MKKLAKIILVAMLTFTITPLANTQAKTKVKLNKTSISIQKGKTYTLKIKGTKKNPKWSSNKKSIATVSKKGKVTAKKAGNAVITAKIGKKKYNCKVRVWQKTETKKPTTTTTTTTTETNNTNVNPVGTRTNPADPRNGVTVTDYNNKYYFKLNQTYTGDDAINQLKLIGEWGEYEQEELSNHSDCTPVFFSYEMSAISGYDKYYLDGIDIINPYSFYNDSATQNLPAIDAIYTDNTYDRSNIKLFNGGSSQMYFAFFAPKDMHTFCYNNDGYWVKYTF